MKYHKIGSCLKVTKIQIQIYEVGLLESLRKAQTIAHIQITKWA